MCWPVKRMTMKDLRNVIAGAAYLLLVCGCAGLNATGPPPAKTVTVAPTTHATATSWSETVTGYPPACDKVRSEAVTAIEVMQAGSSTSVDESLKVLDTLTKASGDGTCFSPEEQKAILEAMFPS